MASIFTLFGEIFIDNEKANESIDKTTEKGATMGDKLKTGFDTVGKIAAGVGAAAIGAGTALVGMAMKTSDAAGDIYYASQRAGVSAEEFQKMAYAAAQNAVDVGTLEKAMSRANKSLSDATEGNKATAAAYEKLGIDIKKISQEKNFDTIIKKLADMGDVVERDAIANDIFGRSYANLLPLLSEGSDGIEALKEQAEDLGGVMSNEAALAGKNLGDTMDALKFSLGGLFNQMGSAIIPIIQELAETFIALIPTIVPIIEQILPVMVHLMETLAPIFVQIVEQLLPPFMEIITAVLPLLDVIIETVLPPLLDLMVLILPLLADMAAAIMPVIVDLIKALLPLIEPIFSILEPIFGILEKLLNPLIKLLDFIIPPLTAVIEVLSGVITDGLGKAFENLMPIIDLIMEIFGGLIDFISGVFSGDWEQAWEGIVSMFKGIINLIPAILEGMINGAIWLINQLIKGINALTGLIGIGEIGLIKDVELPRLAVGLDYVPYDEYPALLHRGEKVLTAEQAAAYRDGRGGGSGANISIHNPTIMRPSDLDWLLDALIDRLKQAGVSAI
jgi:phage-related minor tail protein